jgi:poly(hydroxyalkanoate) granule-associated protein
MAKRKTKSAKAVVAKFDILDSAHQIWLAGLGAMARAQHEGPKLFHSLVTEGEQIQDRTSKLAERTIKDALESIQSTVGSGVTAATDKAQETWDNIEKIFQSRVQKAIHQLGVPTSREINALTRKVEELTASVESLSRSRAAPKRTQVVKTRLTKTRASGTSAGHSAV